MPHAQHALCHTQSHTHGISSAISMQIPCHSQCHIPEPNWYKSFVKSGICHIPGASGPSGDRAAPRLRFIPAPAGCLPACRAGEAPAVFAPRAGVCWSLPSWRKAMDHLPPPCSSAQPRPRQCRAGLPQHTGRCCALPSRHRRFCGTDRAFHSLTPSSSSLKASSVHGKFRKLPWEAGLCHTGNSWS